jgi:hypothetical protein
MVLTPINVLRRARDLVEAGWTQGVSMRHVNGEPHYCVGGAIDQASGFLQLPYCASVGVFASANGLQCVRFWNDQEGRTKDQVLRAFDKAIAYAEAQP